jgi:hypothetical protein
LNIVSCKLSSSFHFWDFWGKYLRSNSACYFIPHSIFVKCGLSRDIILKPCALQHAHTHVCGVSSWPHKLVA